MIVWGKAAIEVSFGGPRNCDRCNRPAIAMHGADVRCKEHLTDAMRKDPDAPRDLAPA
jgi:hypothetical protein